MMQSPQEAAQIRAAAEQARANAEQVRANADRIIEQAIKDAENAAQRAAEQAGADAPPPPSPPDPPRGRPIIISQDNGEPVTIDFDNGNLVITQDGNTREIPWQTVVPSGAVDIAQALAATMFFLVIGWPIARAIARFIDRRGTINNNNAQLQAQFNERFEALERNVDTVAIEMERLSEAQRFTSKLLAERGDKVPVNARS